MAGPHSPSEAARAAADAPTFEALSSLGIERRGAVEEAQSIRTFIGPESLAVLLEGCAHAASPALAWNGAERVLANRAERRLHAPDAEALRLLALLCGASDLAAQKLARHPRWLDALRLHPHLGSPLPHGALAHQLAKRVARVAPGDAVAFRRALRRFKYRELLRLMVRDLDGQAPLLEVARELSELASVALDAAVRFAFTALVQRHGHPAGVANGELGFVVLGMGKLGGGELNISSDVDVLFLYAADGHTAGGPQGPLTHFQFYARLAEEVTAALAQITEDGFVFRVDLDLRPEGRSGPIVNALPAAEHYYLTYGRTWERAAMLKARAVAGDRALGERFLAAIQSFIFRRSVDLAAVEELRAQKAQIDRKSGSNARDLKLGPGGIREVEFFVQAFQLLAGGKQPELRERSTLPALDRLLFAGLINARDRDALAEAYVLLRRAEHRLQMVAERQTHLLPDDPKAQLRLARALGFVDAAELDVVLARHREAVRLRFADLLHAARDEPEPADPRWLDAVDREETDALRRERLGELGFRNSESALANLERLAHHRDLPFSEPAPPAAALSLLAEVSASPDPDQALLHLAELFAPLTHPRQTYDLLVHHRQAARLLISLFGSSDFLSRYFLRHPELLEALVGLEALPAVKDRARLTQELAARLEGLTLTEDVLTQLGRFKNEEVLRIGLRDVAGQLSVLEVGRQLSLVADVILDACLRHAERELSLRFGAPMAEDGTPTRLAIVAMGKFGGLELGYHSDLDLILLYSAPGETRGGARTLTNSEYFARLAQRLLSHLSTPMREGALYRADTRLRPSGNQGALVSTVDAFVEHHLQRAQLWEQQALLKARAAAGDLELWARAREAVRPAVFDPDRQPEATAREIDRLRIRMERELALEKHDYDPKLGHGGLVDIEFAVQFLQLLQGAREPTLWVPNTVAAIGLLERTGLLSSEDATLLRDAYVFLRRLENRLRIVHGAHLSRLPRGGPELTLLARRLGYAGNGTGAGERLLADYRNTTARVRATYQRLLGLAAE